MTNPISVHIGGNVAYTTETTSAGFFKNAPAGSVAVLDANKNVLTASSTNIAAQEFIFLASKTNSGNVIYSQPIRRKNIDKIEAAAPQPPAEEVVKLKFVSVTEEVEYVVRIVYKDINDHPGQFTQTYRYMSKKGDTPKELVEAFEKIINKQDYYSINPDTSRVIASVTTSGTVGTDPNDTLVLTGKVRTDNGGLYALNHYAQVNFEVGTWYIYNNSKVPEYIKPDATVTMTQAPVVGKGFWQLVRDREKLGIAYKGGPNALHWPATTNSTLWYDLNTTPNSMYSTITIISDEPYISLQAQYPEKTKVQTELYLLQASTLPAQNAAIKSILNLFIGATSVDVINTSATGVVTVANSITVTL
jgi:hypothetical protein